jgi:[ribosomal protein S5]-alanine N-acetyltransferase
VSEDLKPWFPLETQRLRLREFREDDFEDVHAYAQSPEVCRFMEWGPNTREDTEAFMQRKWAEQAQWPRDMAGLAVEHLAEGRVIGSIRLAVTDRENLAGDFGYSLHPDYWRQGYATEAARAVIEVGFRTLGLHRIWADCDPDNVGSWGVMEKLGLRREAHHRENKLIKGRWRDSYVYAILAEEWT